MKKSRKRLTAAMAILCCLSLLVGSFAFFTDRLTANTGATAGNMDLVFTDISSSKTGSNGIESLNTYAVDKSWEKESLISADGIINPGDYFDLSYTVSNEGNKSMDVRQQLVLTSDKELTAGAEEYVLTIIGDRNDTTKVPGKLSDDKKSITYDLTDITLNGIGLGAEKEAGISISKETYIVRLDFAKAAGNAFMGSNVAVSYKAQAKQHRNTNDSHWVTWAELETSFGKTDTPDTNVITYDGDYTDLPSALNSDGEVTYYQFSDTALTAESLQNYSLTATSPATPRMRTFALTPSDTPYSETFKLSESEGTLSAHSEDATVLLDGVVVATTADNVSVDETTFPTAGLYVSNDFAGYSLILTEETIESVKLTYENSLVPLGETAAPELVITPADRAESVSIQYEVLSGSEYVSVDPDTGVISGLAEGSAVILVTVTDAAGNSTTSRCTVSCENIVAFAVYSADDQSLTFYKNADYETLAAGETYREKTVTALYAGFEKVSSPVPWSDVAANVSSVVVAEKIQPANTAYWFSNFTNCTSFDLKLINTSKTTSMLQMFNRCSSIKELDLSTFDTSNVTNMSNMFSYCYNLSSLDVSHFNTANVVSMSDMFADCQSLTSLDVSNFNTIMVKYMERMFANCRSLTTLDLNSFNTSGVTNMSAMFSGCRSLTNLNISSFNTSSVKDMSYMFQSCVLLTSLDVSGFRTANVTNMAYMFDYCNSLTSLDLSSFSTTQVTNMEYMFRACKTLISLDLSSFNTSKVTKMDRMFSDCRNLEKIFASSVLWSTKAVKSSSWMFEYCSKLSGQRAYNASYVDKTFATTNYGYLTNKVG